MEILLAILNVISVHKQEIQLKKSIILYISMNNILTSVKYAVRILLSYIFKTLHAFTYQKISFLVHHVFWTCIQSETKHEIILVICMPYMCKFLVNFSLTLSIWDCMNFCVFLLESIILYNLTIFQYFKLHIEYPLIMIFPFHRTIVANVHIYKSGKINL